MLVDVGIHTQVGFEVHKSKPLHCRDVTKWCLEWPSEKVEQQGENTCADCDDLNYEYGKILHPRSLFMIARMCKPCQMLYALR